MKLETTLDIKEIVNKANLAEDLSENDLATIGTVAWDEWDLDVQSRQPWEQKMKLALALALQVTEQKTFPWSGASNVKFPLVTIAAMQYHARAYPALIPSPDIVKCRILGDDPDGSKALRAQRVSEHMSFQILEEDETWEEWMDKALLHQAIVGTAFKKTYFDPALQHNVSEHVLTKDLYVPYFTSSFAKASRITQVLYMSENDLYERYHRGIFLDWNKDIAPQNNGTSVLEEAKDKSQGVTPPPFDPSQPFKILEQHRYLDLDGDGYNEPYIVYVREDTKTVLRVVARFKSTGIERKNNHIVYIKPDNYFTKYPFIPSPDGGFYDLGFGALLSPLNESINTLINQLVDAGTLSNTAGGFLGRGVKFRSGESDFKPFEWKRVDSTGDDLRKGVFPLPVREPSQVLFALLGMMIDYGERIGMAVDPLVGKNPGQNTPAETSRTMVQEGQRVFTAIFKRTYRSLKEEFRKWYDLNAIFLEEQQEYYSLSSGEAKKVLKLDYRSSPKDILPAADPNMVSDETRIMQAGMLKQAALSTPGYNMYEVEKKYLAALRIPDIERIFPDPNGPNAIPQQPDTKVIIESMKVQVKELDIRLNNKIAQVKLLAEIDVNRAKINKLYAEAEKLKAEAKGVEMGQQIAAISVAIGVAKNHQDGLLKALEILADLEKETKQIGQTEQSSNNEAGMGPMESGPSDTGSIPIVETPTVGSEEPLG